MVDNGNLGQVDESLVEKAIALGINLLGGYVRNTDKRVVIGNRLFLSIGCGSRYRLRSRIVWWLHTGDMLDGWEQGNLHHKNSDRIDDRIENLELIDHIAHAIEHNPSGTTDVVCECKQCHSLFKIRRHRLKESGRGSFCSISCYYRYPKTEETRQRQSESSRLAHAKGKR